MVIVNIALLHYAKHSEQAISNELTNIIKRSIRWCPFNHNLSKKTDIGCYESNPEIQSVIELIEMYKQLFFYLEINPYMKKDLDELINRIKSPLTNRSWAEFKYNLEQFIKFVVNHEKDFYNLAKMFTCMESVRLGEALVCFNTGTYLASTIMAVSAVEARLHALMRLKNKHLYHSKFENATLGGVLKLLDPMEYKEREYKSFKKIVPEKHLPLIALLNEYRIFSAHPKNEKINYNLASAIIGLSFSLLIDKQLQLPKRALISGKAPEK